MGKSSLAWYWLQNDVGHAPLHGIMWFSFYEGESSFSKFLNEAIIYASNKAIKPSELSSSYEKVRILVNLLREHRILLVLDGFERQLRAYASLNAIYQRDEIADVSSDARACVDLNAARLLRDLVANSTQGKVLITTRLMVRDLEDRVGDPLAGCYKVELPSLHSDDTVAFMRVQGVTKGTRTEIVSVCESYGYHPLSLRLLSGLIARDKRNPGDIATAPRHDVHANLIARQHHVLEVAYNSLPDEFRMLLSQMAAFRSPMTYGVLAVFNQFGDEAKFDEALGELIERGLVLFDTQRNRYDLHPIVRRYAYERLADKVGIHTRLMEYLSAVPEPEEKNIHSLEDLTLLIERYYHTARAGLYDAAYDLFYAWLNKPLYYRFGAYQTYIELQSAILPDSEGQPSLLKDVGKQADILSDTANAYTLSGQPRRAVPLVKMATTIDEKQGNKEYAAISLSNLATQQMLLGELTAAEMNLRRRIELCREIKDEFLEAEGHMHLGRLFAYQGLFEQAEAELRNAQTVYDSYGVSETNFVGVVRAYHAWTKLLEKDAISARDIGQQALEMALSESRSAYAGERDVIRAEWVIGAALVILAAEGRQDEIMREAEAHLTEALNRCHRISLVELEPDILLNWAHWHHAKGNSQLAREHAEEALTIADRCEYRLKRAEIHNFFAVLLLESGDHDTSRNHAQTAYDCAWCDGPPYYYKPALEEAKQLLERTKAKSKPTT